MRAETLPILDDKGDDGGGEYVSDDSVRGEREVTTTSTTAHAVAPSRMLPMMGPGRPPWCDRNRGDA